MKFDLSQFKKVHADVKSTTLRHPNGHEIKIAHHALHPTMQKQLQALPTITPTKLAEGGKVKKMDDGGPTGNKNIPGTMKDAAKGGGESDVPSISQAWGNIKNSFTPEPAVPSPSPQAEAEGGEIKKYADGTPPEDYNPDAEMPESPDAGHAKSDEPAAPEAPQETPPQPSAPLGEHVGLAVGTALKALGHEFLGGPGTLFGALKKPAVDFGKGVALSGALGDQAQKNNLPQQAPSAADQYNPDAEMPSTPDAGAAANAQRADNSDQNDNLPGTQDAPAGAPTTPSVNQPAMQQPVATPPQAAPTPPPQQLGVADDLRASDAAWQHDLQNGHITPKTYQDMFNKHADGTERGTLGKLGAIFGMLVSGGGSGITGQPNVAMAAWNNAIQNDLEAQKASKTNALDFNKINYEHELQKANAKYMGQQGNLAAAEAGIKTDALQHMQANRNGLADQIAKVKAMSPGTPERMQAEQGLALLSGQIDNMNSNIADQAELKSNFAKLYMSGAAGGNSDQQSNINSDRLNALERQGKMNIPGGMSSEDIGAATKEASIVDSTRAERAQYIDSFNKLKNMALAGKFTPAARAAEIATMTAMLSHETAGRYNEQEAGAQANGMFPAAFDLSSTTAEKMRKGLQFFDAQEARTPTLDRFGLKNPLRPELTEGGQALKSKMNGGQDGTTQTHKGVKYQKVNGGWKKVQ